jgi:limonene-1,2-epoxide hydrolase
MQEAPSAEAVFHHHLEAFKNNDLDEIIKDYTDESEIWSPEGKIVGLEGIAAFFSYVFTLLPKDRTRFELKYYADKEEKV